MKSSLAIGLACAGVLAAGTVWRQALPGYHYHFPGDYFSHPGFRTEWWYYTGNLQTSGGKRFGYELTFFRHALSRDLGSGSVWDVPDVWLAHLALSDINGQRFYHTERLNRPGPGLAGADIARGLIWNGNWFSRWSDGGRRQQLQAIANDFRFDLNLVPVKPVVIHGEHGISRKGPLPGEASHYISFTRLRTQGTVELHGERQMVEGFSWMDHEFFTHQLTADQAGWDWFSIQFDDGAELMLFRLRRTDGAADPFSAGTWVPAAGAARPITSSEFRLTPEATWRSPATTGVYPVRWSILVHPLNLKLQVTTPLAAQELSGGPPASPAYWEGAIDIEGTRQGHPVRGRGYLEMTGYAGKIGM